MKTLDYDQHPGQVGEGGGERARRDSYALQEKARASRRGEGNGEGKSGGNEESGAGG